MTGNLNDHFNVRETLMSMIGIKEIREIVNRIGEWPEGRDIVWQLSYSANDRLSCNCLWVLTHLDKNHSEWLRQHQEDIIGRLLQETSVTKKRLLLQLLKHQVIDVESSSASSLLDYCFSRINSECEPYAVRCFSLYVAYDICRHFPELVRELAQYLDMLAQQDLSPGLKSGLRQTRRRIDRLLRRRT